jgi:hypothetical protein
MFQLGVVFETTPRLIMWLVHPEPIEVEKNWDAIK